MKKVLVMLLLLIMIVLVSCDEPHEHQWKEEWKWDVVNDYNHHWHECADPTCSEVKKELHLWETDEKGEKCSVCGAEVKFIVEGHIGISEENWNAALNMEEFPSVIKQHLYYPDRTNGFIYYEVLEITENVVYDYELDETLTNKQFESCYVNENGSYQYYRLNSSDNRWLAEDISESNYNNAKLKYVTINKKEMAEIFRYDDFQFNWTNNEYTCDEVKVYFDGEEIIVRNIVFTFKDNKLASYYFEFVGDGGYICNKTTFSYDESDVNIPQYK